MPELTWPSSLQIDTDWSDATSVAIISNEPEVGLPIRRLRSHSVKHVLTANATLSYYELNNIFKPFIKQIGHGLLPFSYTSPVDSITYHNTSLDVSSGLPYTLKRKDNTTYIVSFKLIYFSIGGVIE